MAYPTPVLGGTSDFIKMLVSFVFGFVHVPSLVMFGI